MAITHTVSNALFTSSEGQELASHGTPLFPIAFYQDELEHNRVPWHWHDEMEAVYVQAGETTVSAGRRKYLLRQGQGFFVNANVLHSAQGIKGTHCRYHSLVFHPRLIGSIDSIYWQSYMRPLIGSGMKSLAFDGTQPWHQEALQMIERAWQSGASDAPGYEFEVRAALSELIFLLTRHLPGNVTAVSEKMLRDSERIKQMLRFIQQNYAEDITMADIAASAMIGQSECLRCFRNTIQIPPIQYVKRFRVQRAAELLSSTDRKIADIAAECGFQDASYFNRAFREIRGMTPGEYRQLVGKI